MVRISEEKRKTAVGTKGLILLSGGLDSTLAAKVLLEQGIELEAINFLTCFCTCTKKGCRNEAMKVSEGLGIKLKVLNVTKEYLEVIKSPRYGYGSNLNPCIDCRIFMFKKARGHMEAIGASFVVTGEVLGERPMSQRRAAIELIEKRAGLRGLIVRPLSAKHFEPSIPEQEGIIDRESLLDIQGRSRKPQMELAQKFDITDYPCPAGGCLLTDKGFADRARDLLLHKVFTMNEIQLLRVGRHFRLNTETKLISGRNESENDRLLSLAADGDLLFNPKDVPGPIGLLRGKNIGQQELFTSAKIVSRYSDGKQGETVIEYRKHPEGAPQETTAPPASEDTLRGMRI
jgi:tRNA U34 2-thiouridine synthase MnmA/TrmU